MIHCCVCIYIFYSYQWGLWHFFGLVSLYISLVWFLFRSIWFGSSVEQFLGRAACISNAINKAGVCGRSMKFIEIHHKPTFQCSSLGRKYLFSHRLEYVAEVWNLLKYTISQPFNAPHWAESTCFPTKAGVCGRSMKFIEIHHKPTFECSSLGRKYLFSHKG